MPKNNFFPDFAQIPCVESLGHLSVRFCISSKSETISFLTSEGLPFGFYSILLKKWFFGCRIFRAPMKDGFFDKF